MDTSLFLQNALTTPVLFFFLGVIAVIVKSDLEIPAPLPKLFSLYLLLAIGFRGGLELQKSGLQGQVIPTVAVAILIIDNTIRKTPNTITKLEILYICSSNKFRVDYIISILYIYRYKYYI